MSTARLSCCKRVQSHTRELGRLLAPCRDVCTQTLGLWGKKYIPGSQRAVWNGNGVGCPAGTVAAHTSTGDLMVLWARVARFSFAPAPVQPESWRKDEGRGGEALDPCTKGKEELAEAC